MKEKKEKSKFSKGLCRVWRGLDLARKIILNIVFFVLLFFVLSLLLGDSRPEVPDSTVLVVAPQGTIVEQLAPPGLSNSVNKMVGLAGPETLLKDLLDAIEAAEDDERVKTLLLDLNGLGSAGLTKLQDLGAAVKRFKKSGKKVIATADFYTRNSYYLAAQADEIYLHHEGLLLLEGYSRYRRYYKDGLDKLGVDINLYRVGTYKSAAEPYIRNNMSKPAKEANIRWLGVLWESYLKDVAAGRGITVEVINDYVDRYKELLSEVGGEPSAAALKAGLIDHAATREQLRQRLIDLVGEDEDTHSYYEIGFKDYLVALDRDRWGDRESGDVIAVVVAKGTILDGHQPPGTIGGDSTAALLRKARKDDNVKAILLRVDSGGGSGFASEVIRKEMELARQQGKPVVASMGSVAASGGYWISMASDEVWAYPTTISGSIGGFAMIPTYQNALAKHLGIYIDGVGTNKFAGALRSDRSISKEMGEIIQAIVDNGYKRFITLVANARKMTPEQVEKIAQGRVWIGSDAHKLGLVDHMGGMSGALDSAAKLAKLGKNYKVKYFRKKTTFQQEMMSKLFAKTLGPDPESNTPAVAVNRPLNPFGNMMREMVNQLRQFSRFNDPNGLYFYCMEMVDF